MKKEFKIGLFFLMQFFLHTHFSFCQGKISGDTVITEFNNIIKQNSLINQGVQNGSISETKELEEIQKLLDKSKRYYKLVSAQKGYVEIKYKTAFLIAELDHFLENTDSALRYYQLCIDIVQKNQLPDSLLFRSYIFSGIILYQKSRINDAASFFHKAEVLQLKTPHKLGESERLNNTLGVINYEIGNYRLAKNYFHQALTGLSKDNIYYADLSVNYKINLAQIHAKLQEFDKALDIYHQLIKSGISSNDIYHNIGLVYLNISNGDSAVYFFNKVKNGNKKGVRLYSNLARAYLLLNNPDSASYFLNQADLFRNNPDYLGSGMVMKTKGDFYKRYNDPQKAFAYYTGAIKVFYPSFIEPQLNSRGQKFSGYFSYINLYEVIIARAELSASKFQISNNVDWGNRSISDYQLAFYLIEYIENTYGSDEARLFINKMKYRDHGNAIDLAFSLYRITKQKLYLDILFVIDQQNKASVLALNQVAAEDILGIQTENSREKELKLIIRKLFLLSSQTNDREKLAQYNKQIIESEIEIENLHKNRVSGNQSYKAVPSIDYFKDDFLSKDAALVSYHIFNNRITTIIVTQDSYQAYQDSIPPNFPQLINLYLQSSQDPSGKQRVGLSNYLFKILLGRVDKMNVQRLVIIPDDEINYLPLESLRSSIGYSAIERFSILYQYSASILKKDKRNFSGNNHLGMAPFSGKSSQNNDAKISQLPYSEVEISVKNGMKLIGNKATKTSFLNLAGKYSILHLATHAVSGNGPGQSYIVFKGEHGTNELLYTEEIYGMELSKTRLTILSACETGTGNLMKGEGLMSISRSFSYAGCENIITTMWKSDDFATSYITRRLYYYLNKYYPVDIALQKSKLDYLKDPLINPRLKHPYYWSEIIFIGNFNPAEKQISWINYVFLVLSIVSFLFAIWIIVRGFVRTSING